MKKSSILKYFIAFLVVVASALQAAEKQNITENIVRRAYSSISQIEEGKIFLKPEKLTLKQGIIYVEDVDGEQLAISVVCPSQGRPYMQTGEVVIFNSWICECGTLNHNWDNPEYCWKCKEPR